MAAVKNYIYYIYIYKKSNRYGAKTFGQWNKMFICIFYTLFFVHKVILVIFCVCLCMCKVGKQFCIPSSPTFCKYSYYVTFLKENRFFYIH